MADFNPKFVDLVRNHTTTTGTADFTLGSAVNGFTSLASAVAVGERFYYSCIGVDKPAEREVGRGTLLAGGKVGREPISGAKTNFTSGTKAIALVAAAEFYGGMRDRIGEVESDVAELTTQFGGLSAAARTAASRSALAALATTGGPVFLSEAGREGLFVWSGANLASAVAADPNQGLYIAPSGGNGSTGAWVRRISGPALSTWFGVATGATAAANSAAFNQALATLKALGGTGHGYGSGGSVGLHTPAGVYAFNASFNVDHSIRLSGDFAGGFSGNGTVFNFTAAVDAISISKNVGTAYAEGLYLKGVAGPLSGKHGLKCRGKLIAERMMIEGFDHGINCVANFSVTGENCNGSYFANIAVQNCGWATFTDGPDANNITFKGVHGISNAFGGHFDSSTLGSIYEGGDCSSNGNNPAYRTRCAHNGHVYAVAIRQEAWCSANPPTGAATSNQGWIYLSTGANGPNGVAPLAWSAGLTWHFSAPFANDSDLNTARSIFRDIYVEFDQNPCILSWPAIAYTAQQYVGILRPNGVAYAGQIASGFDGTLQTGGDVSVGGQLINRGIVSSVGNQETFRVSYNIPGQVTVGNQSGNISAGLNLDSAGTGLTGGIAYRYGGADRLHFVANHDQLRVYQYAFANYQYEWWTNNGTKVAQIDLGGLSVVAGSLKVGAVTIANAAGVLQAAAFPARTGDVTSPAGSLVNTIANGAVTLTKMANLSVPLRLIGSALGSSAVVEITPGTGITIGATTVRLADRAAATLMGNPSGAATTPSDITLAGGLAFSGSTLTAAGNLTPVSVAASGAITSSSASAGVGYATGAGGTVTQATSRTTGVTLNRPAGSITLFSATTTAGQVTSFTVTNSTVAATDTINLSVQSGNGVYLALVTRVQAGSFNISVHTPAAVGSAEAPVINFAVVKAVAA